MTTTMRLSTDGHFYIKNGLWLGERKWSGEDCRLTAYQDSGGVWTVGWGHTSPDIGAATKWSQWQCDHQFDMDISFFEAAINKLVSVPLTQGQFDALVSFIYNVGIDAAQHSTLLHLLNSSDYDGAAEQLLQWNKCHGVTLSNLTARRRGEWEMFTGRKRTWLLTVSKLFKSS